MDLIFTRTVIIPAETATRKVIKIMTEQGYTLTHAKAPERGEYVGNCESCGLPIFEKDEYQSDDDGVYWHEECPEGASNEK